MTQYSLYEVKEIIAKKVVGKWKPEHTEKGHFYRKGKKKVDSVTGILGTLNKPHLLPWACKMAVEFMVSHIDDWKEFDDEESHAKLFRDAQFAYTGVRDDAGGIGTTTHEILETYLNEWIANGSPRPDIRTLIPEDADGRVFAGARSGELLFQKHKIIPIASELLVGSSRIGSAGTLDLLVMNDKMELELWDHKTSNQIDPIGYSLQVAAYCKFFEEMSGLKISKSRIMLYSKDYAKVTEYEVANIEECWKMFKHLCKIYHWKNNDKEKCIKNVNKITI